MMTSENKKGHTAVFGIFSSRSMLKKAVGRLKADGFRNSDISVLLPDSKNSQNLAHQKGTKAPEGATAGASSGFAIGGVLGWLAGIGALAVPGVGPFVAAGPIIAAITGAGLGGTVGGLTGALIGFGIPEYEAKLFETCVQRGGMLMSVHVDDLLWSDKAKNVLQACGAQDIDVEAEQGFLTRDLFLSQNFHRSSTPRS